VSVPTYTELGLAALVLLAVFFVFIYFIFQLRKRRAQLANEPMPSREQLDDRAYNQIHIARAAAERLERSGVDVENVATLLDNAEKARARGDPDTATALARSAQETLVRLRSAPPSRVPFASAAPSTVQGAIGGLPPAATDGAWLDGASSHPAPVAVSEVAAGPDATVGRLPKNKAESRFQLNLLEEDVRRAQSAAPAAAETVEGGTLLHDGRAAFDRGDYTEALRLGLRGRRRVGGRLETLAPSRATQAEPSDDESTPAPVPLPTDGGPSTCANCGAPMKGTDGFCRACGASRGSARCGQCGEALAADDRFCGACGGPVRA
jgi:Double zinc ribbon